MTRPINLGLFLYSFPPIRFIIKLGGYDDKKAGGDCSLFSK